MKKLSPYTIATNCTDITDCNYGIREIFEAVDYYKEKLGRKEPQYFWNRLEKLQAKRDKFSVKEHGMKYDEWLMTIPLQGVNTFHFSQHLSAQLDNGESYDWSKVLKLAKELNIEATPQELMQACEVAIVMSARRMISQHSEWSAGQCFEQMKRLYSQQPIISTNSSDSLRWQQYSTPCPISYLAGLYVSQGNPQYGFYEPTAGNGMLTIALPVGSTVVNEIDPVRFENLKKAGYAQTFNGDAVALANSEHAQRNYNVIMNPPFGNLKQSEYLYRDGKVADNSATYTFKRLDHKIAVLSLEKFMGDNGARAAIIVGGKLAAKYNKADDEAYWNKQGRLQGAFGDFISYLNRAYLVDDIFYIDGKLYSKQGTQFPIVLILVRGRRKQWDSDPLCKWRTYDSIKDKPVQSFDELMIRMRPYLASNEHDALLERLNAKLVRLEKMKIDSEKEFTVVNKGLGETDEEYKKRLLAFLTENAENFRFVPCTWNSFLNEFGTEGECTSPIGTIIVDYDDLEKMQNKFRDKYFGLIKPTLQNPLFIIRHNERDLFVKSFIDKQSNTVIFFSVVKSENGTFELSSNHEKRLNSLLNKIREGQITLNPKHFTTALNSPDKLLPNYRVLSVGFPYRCKSN